ncbi:MAG: divalent-cation tolerance protein CutA [Mariprofundus sp.]|nr:divalent-cation tolerance protein CutA [Mariprofundus sp.]
MANITVVHTSMGSELDANKLAEALIEKRLAACVQINGPGVSVYSWQGEIEKANEWYLTIKTPAHFAKTLLLWLEKHHPYEIPEISWSTCVCSLAYGEWAADAVDVRK